jgi:hypothetical protein
MIGDRMCVAENENENENVRYWSGGAGAGGGWVADVGGGWVGGGTCGPVAASYFLLYSWFLVLVLGLSTQKCAA